MSLIGLTSAAQGLKLKNGGDMKIRIAKKKAKKEVLVEYPSCKKNNIKLTKISDRYNNRYKYVYREYSKPSFDMVFLTVPRGKKKKPFDEFLNKNKGGFIPPQIYKI